MPKTALTLAEQMKLIGQVKITYTLGGREMPIDGQFAARHLASALVDIIDQIEPLNPNLSAPVIDRVERIHARVHKLIEDQFQERWHQKKFER